MTELVGLLASITALIQISAKVASYIYILKGAGKSIERFCNELTALEQVLEGLKKQAENTDPPPLALLDLSIPLKMCSEGMEEVKTKLENAQKRRRNVKKLFRRAKWPLEEAEILQVISQIERHKTLFNLALTANHIYLSKAIHAFVQHTDMSVNDLLKLAQQEFAALRKQRQNEVETIAVEKRGKILDWIFTGQFDQRHIEISRKRQKHTGKWLSQEPKFQAWIKENPDFRLLWGHGIPGAGKTFLSSLVIDDLEIKAQTEKFGVAHIYFSYKEQDQQTPVNVLRSLIKQLAIQAPQVAIQAPKPEAQSSQPNSETQQSNDEIVGLEGRNPQSHQPITLEGLYDRCDEKKRKPTFEELKEALLAIMQYFTRTFFIIDALDECDEETQRKDLLPVLHALGDNRASIFMTSRPYSRDIYESFTSSSASLGKVELAAKEENVIIYVEEKIKGNPHARALIKNDLRKEIVAKLVRCCKGMFLLVHFHIEDLCKYTTLNQVRMALARLDSSLREESSLNGIYTRTMENINHQHSSRKILALKVLSWLVYARRTMTVAEIRVAVSIEESTSELDEAGMPDNTMLVEVCAGLTIIDDNSNTIQLAHYSVQEYLVGNIEFKKNWEPEPPIVCLRLLSMSIFTEPCDSEWALNHRSTLHPFWEYAVLHLYPHLQLCDESASCEEFLKFLTNTTAVGAYAHARESLVRGWFQPPIQPSPLHEAALAGHRTTVYRLLSQGANALLEDYRGQVPLSIAVENGHAEVVGLLLEAGADTSMPNRYGETVLHSAVSQRHKALVQLLLDHGANPSLRDHNRRAPLHTAVSNRDEEVIRLLLEAGADTSIPNEKGQTPLYVAVIKGEKAIVNLLLDANADPSIPDCNRWTPLYFAASNGYEAIVLLLLEKGAETSQSDNCGRTPLYTAAEYGHSEIVHMLLKYGANMLSDRDGWTPLHAAVSQGHQPAVQLLLQNGADVFESAKDGWTPLHAAAARGRNGIARLLLDIGAHVSSADEDGWTPLHTAAYRGKRGVVRMLLERGADPSVMTNSGETALSLTRNERIALMLSGA